MIRFFAGHPTAANLLMVLLFTAGLVSVAELRRETFPEFTLDVVQVSVPYPGASAEMVEEAICQRLEEALEILTDVDEMRCEAREGLGTATVDMVEGADVNRFLTDVKAEVDGIDDFPDLAEPPVIKQLERTDRVVSLAIAGPMAERDLIVFAEDVKERALRQGVASRVDLLGFSQRQIRIEVKPEALRQYGLSVADVADAVSRHSIELPSGLIETRERDILVRFADRRHAPLPFEDLVILGGATGAELRLGQIARITDRFEREEERVYLNGQRAALLQINKTRAEDTLTVMQRVRAFVEDERQRAPPGIDFELTRDTASIVKDRLDMLVNNGMVGLALVFLVLWLFFSFRFAFWVAMGLPATFLGTIAVLVLIDYSINMLTMVALLIAIGLIMDDAIVIAENVARHRRLGKTPLAAAVDGTREVAAGVVSSFVTTVCIFAPLAFLEGDIGRAMRVVPVVLIITLAVSLVEAFLILPHHVSHAMKDEQPGRFRRRFDAGFERVRENGLGRLVDAAVRWRYLTIGMIVLMFLVSVGMVAGGHVKFRAFPELDGNVIEARLLLPQGTPLARTEAAVEKVVTALHRVDDAFTPLQPDGQRLVRNVLIQFNRNVDAFETGPHVATVTVDLLRAEVREGRIADYLGLWRQEVGRTPDVLSMTFTEPQIGPAGIPIEIRLQGDDLDTLKAASMELQGWLARYPGVADLQDDLRPGKPELRLRLRDGAVTTGLDAASLARQLRAALHGVTADEIQVGRELFEIDVRLEAAGRNSLSALDDFPVFLPNGRQTPLSAVAVIEQYRGYARINRIDKLRTVVLRGDLDANVANLGEILADTRARFLPDLERRYPDIRISLEGETARQRETGSSMRRSLMVGLLGIFVLLSFQFRSYLEPITVMAAIPLALIGVVWGHVAMGLDLSMPSALGAVSLAGIVVNDSILLVMFVKRNARQGLAVVDAARQASRDRFRPVLLTSLTTIAGVMPLLFERSLQAQVLVPLVTSLAFGLLASTILVLILLPALYAVFHDLGLTELAKRRRQEGSTAEATS